MLIHAAADRLSIGELESIPEVELVAYSNTAWTDGRPAARNTLEEAKLGESRKQRAAALDTT